MKAIGQILNEGVLVDRRWLNENGFDRISGLEEVPFGTWDWPVWYSVPEQAFLELLSTIDSAAEIQQADALFEGAANLRPVIVQAMMEQCRQVKAKRLFLWLAKRHNFPWFNKLDTNKFDIGKGKRQIVKGGILDKDYLITIPKEMVNGQTESLF